MTITIYNSAGEQVKLLASDVAALFSPAADFAMDQQVFAPKNGQTALITAGGQSLAWAGDNDGAQLVKNGLYYVKMEYRDQFGHVESMTKEITVLSSGQFYSVSIYNSAGEEVANLAASTHSGNAPSRIDPDKQSIVLGKDSGGAGLVTFDLGNGTTVSWDGNNGQGQKVASGSYLAQLIETHDAAPKSVASAAIIVLNMPESILDSALIAPNPLNMLGQAGGGTAILKFAAVAGTTVIGRLYNMAGEMVLTASNDMIPGELRMDLGGRGLSSGAYILSVTARAPWGTVERRNLKLVILR
jgi:flagellar hook assembly protein FlgD